MSKTALSVFSVPLKYESYTRVVVAVPAVMYDGVVVAEAVDLIFGNIAGFALAKNGIDPKRAEPIAIKIIYLDFISDC